MDHNNNEEEAGTSSYCINIMFKLTEFKAVPRVKDCEHELPQGTLPNHTRQAHHV